MAKFVILSQAAGPTPRLLAIKAFVEKNGHTMEIFCPENEIILQDNEWPISIQTMSEFDLAGFLATYGTSEAPPADPEQTIVQEPSAVDLEKPQVGPYGVCPECGEPGIGTERSIDGSNFCANHHRFPRVNVAAENEECVYGTCPECGGPGVSTEKRPDGNSFCANGHCFPRNQANAAENEETTCSSENEERCGAENEENADDADTVEIEQDGMVPAFSSVIIKRINGDLPVDALVDTGSDLCVLGVGDLIVGDTFVKFSFGDATYKVPSHGKKTIVATNGEETRPVVRFGISIDGTSYDDVEFTVTKRPEGAPSVLIGREFLAANDLLVQP